MVRVELKGYEQALAMLDTKPVKQAAASALKKVAISARVVASEEIVKKYNVKSTDLKARITVDPPRSNALVAQLTIGGKPMSLAYFNPRQTVVNRVITRTKAGLKTKTNKRSAKFQGVTVSVLKGASATQLKSGFLAQMKSGHIGVMQRIHGKMMKGKNKQAIMEKSVISIASMAQNQNVEPAVLKRMDEAWAVTFPAELNYYINVKGKPTGG
jgi:hypothetical protein